MTSEERLNDANDAWWHDDHFGENCEEESHTEQCVDTAFQGGWDAALRSERQRVADVIAKMEAYIAQCNLTESEHASVATLLKELTNAD